MSFSEENMKILCYARPWNNKQFCAIAKGVSKEADIETISEHSAVDSVGLPSLYYAELEKRKSGIDHGRVSLGETEKADIVKRCRLLRKLPINDAFLHLDSMYVSIKNVIKNVRPRLVLSLTVDSYVIDILRILCHQSGVQFIGLVPTFVNGCFRVTSRGEPTSNPCPIPDIEFYLREKLLRSDYIPEFNSKSVEKPIATTSRRWFANLARIPYFFMKRHLTRDNFNYHYWSSQIVSLNNFCFPPSFIGFGVADWRGVINASQKPKLYVPLQMFPEATIDYWCDELCEIDYYDRLFYWIERMSRFFHVAVKEHPSVLGSRPSDFYKKLKTCSFVTAVPTSVPSSVVLDACDSVMVWTGSVGLEAALRGKPVYSVCSPYYATGRLFRKINTSMSDADIKSHYEEIASGLDICEERREISSILNYVGGQLFQGRFINDGSANDSDSTHLDDAINIGESLRPIVFARSCQPGLSSG